MMAFVNLWQSPCASPLLFSSPPPFCFWELVAGRNFANLWQVILWFVIVLRIFDRYRLLCKFSSVLSPFLSFFVLWFFSFFTTGIVLYQFSSVRRHSCNFVFGFWSCLPQVSSCTSSPLCCRYSRRLVPCPLSWLPGFSFLMSGFSKFFVFLKNWKCDCRILEKPSRVSKKLNFKLPWDLCKIRA